MAAIFNSPSKYIQGPDELAKLGSYVEPLGAKALVIVTPSGKKRVGAKIEGGFAEAKAELLQLSEMVLRASGRSLEALEKNDKVIARRMLCVCAVRLSNIRRKSARITSRALTNISAILLQASL